MIRVLIADGSSMQRQLLHVLLERAGGFAVVGSARDGAEAVRETARLGPDIILLDSQLPVMNGLEATAVIMREFPTPIVISDDLQRPDASGLSLEAVKSGALAVVEKPGNHDAPSGKAVRELVRTLRLMSEVKVVGRRISGRAKPPLRADRNAIDAIALCGSTGAPGVIAEILGALEPASTPPILVVQHLTSGFAPRFTDWLRAKTSLTIELARNGALIEPGHVYLAPDAKQMGLRVSGHIRLAADPPEDGFQPSASYLYRSLAKSCGPRAMGIVLTGMGYDGARGLLELRQAGGLTVAQSQGSCVIYGMPQAAVKIGAVKQILTPKDIAELIKSKKPSDMETTGVSRSIRSLA